MEWPSRSATIEDSEGYVRQSRARWLLGEQWEVGVWRGRRLVAGSGFMVRGRPLEHGVGEIGMWVRADEAGRGLGTRVLRAMVDWADPTGRSTSSPGTARAATWPRPGSRRSAGSSSRAASARTARPPRARPSDHPAVRPAPQRPPTLAGRRLTEPGPGVGIGAPGAKMTPSGAAVRRQAGGKGRHED